LKVGGEALQVVGAAIGPDDDVPVLGPAIALLVGERKLGPQNLVFLDEAAVIGRIE
jgi:hypothetical protein